MATKPETHLSRRERQIMDIIYRRGRASVADVLEDMVDRPSYSSVRTLIRILERKGHLGHVKEGNRYIYLPTRSRDAAGRSAFRRLVHTFFEGSSGKAIAALLARPDTKLSEEELAHLTELIEEAKKGD